MSSEDGSDNPTDDVSNKNVSFNAVSSPNSSQQRCSRSTQQNVYTPLSLSPRLESQQVSSAHSENEEIFKVGTVYTKSNNDKNLSVKTKASSSSKCPIVKNQRSSVRPFFCCGSELSLVSLVDGMDLKEESISNTTKIQSIECSSSSEDETELSPCRGRSSGIGSGDISRSSMTRRKKKDKHVVKKKFWSLRLQKKWNPRWKSHRSQLSKSSRDFSQQSITSGCSTSQNVAGPSGLTRQTPSVLSVSRATSPSPFLDLFHFFPVEGIAEAAIRRRTEEMAVGLEIDTRALTRAFRSTVDVSGSVMDILRIRSRLSSNSDIQNSTDSPFDDILVNNLILQAQNSRGSIESWGGFAIPQIHTQIDYVHHIVPDLAKITACSYYWGVMDRYEAEHLLENKPPGTFLLRDSAQEDFLFSVSFRRYNRSLHARIEQWNHRFSFDAHDPNVFSASTVCELIEHYNYKDPSLCMFFEPMLTRPLHRTFPFSLQHMCRTVICDRISYDDIQALPIPNSFKKFLQAYHYKQKVRVRRFDAPEYASADSRVVN